MSEPAESAVFDFELTVCNAVDELPAELREAMSNVSVVVEDEPPRGRRCLASIGGCR